MPSCLFWRPELSHPEFFPDKKPMCIWHLGCTSCVQHLSWADLPRRMIGRDGAEFIWGSRYICTSRKGEGIKPYSFHSYNPDAVAQMPMYMRQLWNRLGGCITSRGAINIKVLDSLRSGVSHGLGVSSFLKMLTEAHKLEHRRKEQQWIGAISISQSFPIVTSRMSKRSFCTFDSVEYGGYLPSASYLCEALCVDIERRLPFYIRHLQMIDGLVLSGDHSHKIAKVIRC